jgi:hypothetical protein
LCPAASILPWSGHGNVAHLLFEDAEQATREQALIRRAYFDELTGLPNRRLIEQSVKALTDADETPFALAFIDVDGFKHVNDFYGHNIGDGLLVQIADASVPQPASLGHAGPALGRRIHAADLSPASDDRCASARR